eukprot:gene15975-18009_t
MLVLGILACDDAAKSEYYCPPNSCNHGTDHYVTNMNWGPCGLGYGTFQFNLEVRRACFNPTPSPLIVIPVVFLTLILYVLTFISDINAVASDVRKRSTLVVPVTSDNLPEKQCAEI